MRFYVPYKLLGHGYKEIMGFGIPKDVDTLEGWITDPELANL